MSNNFPKTSLLKNHELETFGTSKRILRKKIEGYSYARKRPVVLWTFHTFVSIANQRWTATKNSSREKKIQGNAWKVQNTTGSFLVQLHSSIFFFFNPFPSAKSFQFMNFSEAMFCENYLTSDFHTNTVISRRVCLLVKMSSKTVIRPINLGVVLVFKRTEFLTRGQCAI